MREAVFWTVYVIIGVFIAGYIGPSTEEYTGPGTTEPTSLGYQGFQVVAMTALWPAIAIGWLAWKILSAIGWLTHKARRDGHV